MTVFKDIKISFRLNCLKATRPRVPTITELTNARFTILHLDELVRDLTFVVEEYKVHERSGFFLTAEAVLKIR